MAARLHNWIWTTRFELTCSNQVRWLELSALYRKQIFITNLNIIQVSNNILIHILEPEAGIQEVNFLMPEADWFQTGPSERNNTFPSPSKIQRGRDRNVTLWNSYLPYILLLYYSTFGKPWVSPFFFVQVLCSELWASVLSSGLWAPGSGLHSAFGVQEQACRASTAGIRCSQFWRQRRFDIIRDCNDNKVM